MTNELAAAHSVEKTRKFKATADSDHAVISSDVRGITLAHFQPGKPQQNAYVERYNRTAQHEWLDL